MVKFANNDKSRLCCSSKDRSLSVCDVSCELPMVLAILRGHTDAVTGSYRKACFLVHRNFAVLLEQAFIFKINKW